MKNFYLPLLFLLLGSPLLLIAQQDSNINFDLMQADSMQNSDFSFWLGHWEVRVTGKDQIAGYSRIEGMLNGQAFRESYTTAAGYQGTSYNTYNAAQNRWEQYYVDNQGTVLHLKGNLQDGSMILSDCATGGSPCNRISWTPQPDGTVRQVWEQTKDGGGNWTVLFDGTYFRPEK
ncbi:MAG TPA: hypothetical protein VJ953_17185 [Saprospiraceae bacterium]|nr:hypothetical protein [Saprospiraceae bacterium]